MDSKSWRNKHAQNKYRQSSRSQNKDKKEVSHQLSIKVAKKIDSHIRGPTASSNRAAVNDHSNFYMKNIKTNRSTDNKLDNGIIKKMDSGEKLTRDETHRARIQAKQIQSNSKYTHAFKKESKKVYRDLKSNDKKVIWDNRRKVK
eukprot:TRINITY_DN5798_c0_g1_i1.p1 TRINITY_DN5798_c0_g1~~TRINITY_DN5798_c0_g1_i1.p1  ORF type:complete len:145 (-),score=26.62 TRINITY_DN5798_c0_g1_i1:88-522(-)